MLTTERRRGFDRRLGVERRKRSSEAFSQARIIEKRENRERRGPRERRNAWIRMTRWVSVDTESPRVSVLIPARNEESLIEDCVHSLLDQAYPQTLLEILVLDGMSEDRTREIVEGFAGEYPNVRIVSNPEKTIPSALNIGIAHASGDIILRADAHTLYDINYIRKSVEALTLSGASNVGGVINPLGSGRIGKGIAVAVSSPFGVGNAYYRFSDQPKWVDTVAFGCWRKNTLLSLGGYDESYLVNEDYELNYRLRLKGGKIFLVPEIKCHYFPRSSLRRLFWQYFSYGKWKVRMLAQHPQSLVYRQIVPPIFVFSLLASFALIPLSLWPFLLVSVPYASASLLFSVRTAIRRGLILSLTLPLVFFVIHFSWGLGFLRGLIDFGIPDLLIFFQPVFRKGVKRSAVPSGSQ